METFFTRLHESKPAHFIAVLVALSLVPTIITVLLVANSQDDSTSSSMTGLALTGVVLLLAPLMETLVFQFIPGIFIQRFKLVGLVSIMVMVLPFCFVHFKRAAPLVSLTNGVGGGYILGFCYLICMRKSRSHAFMTTALVHFLHNLIMLGVGYSYQALTA